MRKNSFITCIGTGLVILSMLLSACNTAGSPTVTPGETASVTTTASKASAETTAKSETTAEAVTETEAAAETAAETSTETSAETSAESPEVTEGTSAEVTENTSEVEYHDEDPGYVDADPVVPQGQGPAADTPSELTAAQVQYESQRSAIQDFQSQISTVSSIPCVYINTLGNAAITSKEEYLGCTIDVFNTDASNMFYGVAAGVRVRGNSSAMTDKPPLKIKFAEQQNLLGLHNGEKFRVWVILKTNWFMTADHLAFKLGKMLLGPSRYVSDSEFIHLFVNGEDWGLCLACEQNQVQANRVNIKEAESEATSPTDMGYFFEMDNYAGSDDAPTFWIGNSATPVTDITGLSRTSKDKGYTVKNSYVSDAQLNYLSTYMNSLWQVIYRATYENTAYVINADGTLQQTSEISPEEAVRRVLDVDAAVNMYIMEEIFHDYDRGAGSFFMAIDFSDTSEYRKLTFLAPWDFGYDSWDDDGTGLHAGLFTTSGDINDTDNIWLITLFYNEWFRREVSARYTELIDTGALKAVTAQVDADLNATAADAAYSGQTGRLDGAHQFIAYTNKRIDWLSTQFYGTYPGKN